MEHPPDGVIRFKRWLNAVFEAWIEKRPLYVIVVSFFYRRAISLRFVPPPPLPPTPLRINRCNLSRSPPHALVPYRVTDSCRASGFEPLSHGSRIFSPGALIKYGFVELVILFPRTEALYIYVTISDKA